MKTLPAEFDSQSIRRLYDASKETWWFSVIDVVQVLTDSNNARRYWSDLKRKLMQEAGSEQPYEKIVPLKLTAPDGKKRETDCATLHTPDRGKRAGHWDGREQERCASRRQHRPAGPPPVGEPNREVRGDQRKLPAPAGP